MIPTPHISCSDKNKIGKTVLMPGDPLRAKFIADKFLEDVEMINNVRNMFGYTGTYKDIKISVMGSGMGMGSMGIYSYELFKFYDVENIIRIGSAGAYTEKLNLYDVIMVEDAWSESAFAKTQGSFNEKVIKSSLLLNKKLEYSAKMLNINIKKCRVHSTDVFYNENPEYFHEIRENYGCLAGEMESFALFHNANITGKNASCLLTISDSLVTHVGISIEERQNAFLNMIEIVLNA